MRNQKETALDMLGLQRNAEHLDRRQTDKELIELINTKNQQLAILHQVNTRLGYQLSLLQRKLGIDPLVILKELEKIGDVSVAFQSNLEQLQCLDHLFLAYDETILKQKKIIAMLYSQLQDGQKKAESLIRQKQYLLEENKNKCKKILQIYHRGYPEQNLTTAYIRLLREMDSQKNMLVREESQHILDAYRELQNRAFDIEQELEEQRTNATTYFESFKRQSEELKEALMSVDNLLKVKDFLQKTVNKLGEENTNLQNAKNEMQARIGKLQAEVKSLRSQLFNQKKLNREENERATIQLDSAKSQSENAAKRERQCFNKLMIVEKQLQSAKQNLRSFKRQNQKVKSDFQQTLKMCEAYESKITSLTRKDENVRNMIDQGKEKLQTVLLERDRALLKVQQFQKILENMGQRHRQQLSKQRENYQKMLFQLQQKMRMLNQQKQESESIFMQSQLSYKNQIQKLKRENSLLHQENVKFIQNIHVNTGSEIISKLKQYESKNDSLIKLLNQKQRALKDQENKHEESAHEFESEIRNLNRLFQKQKGLTTQYMKELTQERSRVNILTNEKECLENEIKKLRKNYQFKNVQINDEREYRINELQTKLNQAVKKEKQTRLKAIEMLQKYDEAEERLKNQYEKRIVEVQTQNEKLKKKLSKLRV